MNDQIYQGLELLTPEQNAQVTRQIVSMHIDDHDIDLNIGDALRPYCLRNFRVSKGVFDPSKATSMYFARFLHNNPHLYAGKRVLDMGTGTGLMGITMGDHGASSVHFADISKVAWENAAHNIAYQKLSPSGYGSKTYRPKANYNVDLSLGNLFENVKGKFGVIVYNHPFFIGNIAQDESTIATLASSMVARPEHITDFLTQAHSYLESDGKILMAFWDFASPQNQPWIRGAQLGYDARILDTTREETTLQHGIKTVTELTLRQK